MPSTRRARTALPPSPYVDPADSDDDNEDEDSEDTIIARPRRAAFNTSQATTAAMQRSSDSSDSSRKPVRLTMKNPHGASRLREVTTAEDTRRTSARSSRNRAPVIEDDSDEVSEDEAVMPPSKKNKSDKPEQPVQSEQVGAKIGPPKPR